MLAVVFVPVFFVFVMGLQERLAAWRGRSVSTPAGPRAGSGSDDGDDNNDDNNNRHSPREPA